MTTRTCRSVIAVAALLMMVGCASAPPKPAMPSTPALSDLPPFTVPATLKVPAEIRTRHEAALRLLQAGDRSRATAGFNDVLRRSPDFYPSMVALGYISALDRKYDDAVRRFDAAIALDEKYMPALTGRLDIALVRREDRVALSMTDLILAVAPGREEVRSQQEMLRLRVVQAQLSRGSK